jgi:sulfur-oxidizing protein SoxB
MKRRQFLQALTLLGLIPPKRNGFAHDHDFYELSPFGQARLLHFTDCHAQLMPIYYRESAVNLGTGAAKNQPPHLTGQAWLDFFAITARSRAAYAFTALDFAELAPIYGKMGGFAHLATLVKQLRAQRGAENTLLLDGGDTWQGSATALWTQGQDMVAACNLLGVDVMTGHWEFTYGQAQVLKNSAAFNGDFVAQNISFSQEAQFAAETESDLVFKPYVIKELANARIAIIGQAFPFTPIANPKRFVPDWEFGLQEQRLQTLIHTIQASKQADVIVLLSHNGLDVDLKLATRVTGLDLILGGHTHDALPKPLIIKNNNGKTWVTNAGSYGKFLAVVDLDVQKGRLADVRYRLLPVFSRLLPADAEMQALIDQVRQPFMETLRQPLAVAEQLLYRRDNFHGSFDALLLKALRQTYSADIAFSPGFRWGTTVLKGDSVYFEDLLSHTALTYPNSYVNQLLGSEIKAILEDVADNLFNPDPYYQQGGDMVRVAGLSYRCDPEAKMGQRISACRLANGQLLQAHKRYSVAGWANVNTLASGRPIWEIAADDLLHRDLLHRRPDFNARL